ncbi:MAG: ROK family protein [Planctomycetota bacterium]
MSPDALIGLDFGGTSIKAGAVRASDGAILARATRPFDPDVAADEIFDRAASIVRELEEAVVVSPPAIGLGCAGLFDRPSGRVLASANMPNLVDTSLSEGLGRRIDGRKVIVENDANVAAYGEQWLGAGLEEESLVLLTLGTGVGGGVVLFDELFTGPGGNAGEIGHVVIYPRPSDSPYCGPYDAGLECACGSYGCLERLVSATAAKRRARAAGLTDDLPALSDEARATDGRARALMHTIGRDLGAGLATLVTLFDVDFFAIGGGFGAALDLLEAGAHEVLEDRRYGTRPARIVPATLGADAGWIGAARLTR